MGLNVKNEETHRLVQESASLTAESQTMAVTTAARERLGRLHQARGTGLADRLLTIGADAAGRLPEWLRSTDHGQLLYDEHGLPR